MLHFDYRYSVRSTEYTYAYFGVENYPLVQSTLSHVTRRTYIKRLKLEYYLQHIDNGYTP